MRYFNGSNITGHAPLNFGECAKTSLKCYKIKYFYKLPKIVNFKLSF